MSTLNTRFVRFMSVGVFMELLYLLLFYIISYFDINDKFTVLIAGSICTILNSYLHSIYTFKIKFKVNFLYKYICVQILCLFISVVIASYLNKYNISSNIIGITTALTWGILSYILCMIFLTNTKKIGSNRSYFSKF